DARATPGKSSGRRPDDRRAAGRRATAVQFLPLAGPCRSRRSAAVPTAGGRPGQGAPGTPAGTAGILTYNSRGQLERCLDALRAQSPPLADILVWDNASADDSASLARARGARVEVSARNLGFAAGANELIRRVTTPYFLLVNPDAYLAPDYVERL